MESESEDNPLQSRESTFLIGGKEYLISKKRWWIIFLVCIVSFLDEFSVVFFALVNDVASVYYNQTPAMSDLLSTINVMSRGLFGIFSAMISIQLTFRRLMFLTSATVFTGCLMIATGVSSRENFPLVIMGQVLSGVSASIALILPQVMTSNWFHKNEHGKVFPLPRFFRRISNVTSSIVSTYSLGFLMKNASGKSILVNPNNQALMDKFQFSYTIGYSVLAASAFLVYVSTSFFVTNTPRHALTEHQDERKKKETMEWSIRAEISGFNKLFTNKRFLLILTLFTLMVSIRPLTDFILTSLVLQAFPELTNQFSGLMFSVGHLIGAFAAPIAGYIIHKFRKSEYVFMFGIAFLMLSCALFSLSTHFHSISLLYTGYIMMAFSRDVAFISVNLTSIAILQPEETSIRLKGFVISTSLPWAITPLYSYLVRVIMDRFGPPLASLFPIPFLVTATVLWHFL